MARNPETIIVQQFDVKDIPTCFDISMFGDEQIQDFLNRPEEFGPNGLENSIIFVLVDKKQAICFDLDTFKTQYLNNTRKHFQQCAFSRHFLTQQQANIDNARAEAAGFPGMAIPYDERNRYRGELDDRKLLIIPVEGGGNAAVDLKVCKKAINSGERILYLVDPENTGLLLGLGGVSGWHCEPTDFMKFYYIDFCEGNNCLLNIESNVRRYEAYNDTVNFFPKDIINRSQTFWNNFNKEQLVKIAKGLL